MTEKQTEKTDEPAVESALSGKLKRYYDLLNQLEKTKAPGFDPFVWILATELARRKRKLSKEEQIEIVLKETKRELDKQEQVKLALEQLENIANQLDALVAQCSEQSPAWITPWVRIPMHAPAPSQKMIDDVGLLAHALAKLLRQIANWSRKQFLLAPLPEPGKRGAPKKIWLTAIARYLQTHTNWSVTQTARITARIARKVGLPESEVETLGKVGAWKVRRGRLPGHKVKRIQKELLALGAECIKELSEDTEWPKRAAPAEPIMTNRFPALEASAALARSNPFAKPEAEPKP